MPVGYGCLSTSVRAEPEAVDLLLEVEELGWLEQHVDKGYTPAAGLCLS